MDVQRLRQLFKPAVLNAKAYHVPESAGLIKLDAMENPYSWPDELKQQWLQVLQQAELNRYPDAGTRELHSSLRELFQVPASAGMMFGNGSDELIQIVLMALAPAARTVLAPEPTFVMYRHLSEMLELQFIGVPLQQDFSLDLAAMLDAIRQHDPAVIFLAWPNNPTGKAYAREELQAIIEAANGLVIVDEAYHVFAGQTLMTSVGQYPNMLVMRTLSKLGLAGLRLGTLAGPSQIINELEKIRLPYNIGTLNQLSVQFICRHMDILYEQAEQISRDRETLYRALADMPHIQVWPTAANFILFRTSKHKADDIHAQLLDRNILIKNSSAAHPLLKDCLRVTVGSPAENAAFLEALEAILAAD